jgi:murein DD-endopeptidase MepM/ murein hydrolase activator NlpD
VQRRRATTLELFAADWQRTARSAAEALSSTDGRWAIVSTSITAVIAGSIAWLAAGIIPPSHGYSAAHQRSLMPYELFLRLMAQNKGPQLNYAAFGPSAPATTTPPAQIVEPANSLDNSLAAESAGDDATEANTDVDSRTITLDHGDTLAGALTDAGVTNMDAEAAVAALTKVYSPKLVRAGQTLQLTFEPAPPVAPVASITYSPPAGANDTASDGEDAPDSSAQAAPATPVGRLLSVNFSPTIEHDITIGRATDGGFTAQSTEKKLVAKFHRAGAKIDSSLYLAAMQAGIPAEVVVQMIHMFSYEVDFQRDIKPGDTFEVLYNYYYTPDGQPAKQGDISYATMHLGSRTVALYRYQPPNGDPVEYFDAKGQSAKSMLMKTPVDGARISSGFGMRFHPVLGYTRMHKGIDFAVPTGTPVMAAGSGTIQIQGWLGGYGNFVLINHGNTYATAYGHLSRFAPGQHQGSHVRQGQVIAYSGATGLATGPHLHYEIRINGTQVNPLTVKVARGQILAGHDLRQYLANRIAVDHELASMPLESKVAESPSDLRAAKD